MWSFSPCWYRYPIWCVPIYWRFIVFGLLLSNFVGSESCITAQEVTTPLNVSAWQAALAVHPDSIHRDFITTGLTESFWIGFKCDKQLSSSKSNMRSALSNLAVIDKYLTKEKDASRFIGPLSPGVDVHLSHFWVIPKGHTTGKWRVITDLSYPLESSINDSIDKELCSLKYVTVDIVARMVAMLGPASFMA